MDQEKNHSNEQTKDKNSLSVITKNISNIGNQAFGLADDLENQFSQMKMDSFSDSQKRLITFILTFILDVFVVYPAYFVITIWELIKIINQEIYLNQPDKIRKIFIAVAYYTADILLSLTVIGLCYTVVTDFFTGDSQDDVYYIWCANCFLFFISFILLLSYLYTFSIDTFDTFECTFKYLLRPDHLESLGLGRVKSSIYKEYFGSNRSQEQQSTRLSVFNQITTNSGKQEFIKEITSIATDLNLDLSLFYFCLIDDSQLDFTQSAQLKDDHKQALADSGFYGKRQGTSNILLPIYNYSIKEIKQENINIIVICGLIFLKVVWPFWEVVQSNKVDFHLTTMFYITGFYIYIIAILYKTLNNEDLKRRTLIHKSISSMIDFEEVEVTYKDDYGQVKQGKTINFRNKVDITCTLSLESWDNARRIAMLIDADKSKKYELSYVFLGIYFLFLFIILASIFGDITVFVSKSSVYMKQPILIMNMCIDFILVLCMFFNRLYYIEKFNQQFDDQKQQIGKLRSVTEDLKTLFKFYFSNEIIKLNMVDNILYKKVVDLILDKSQQACQHKVMRNNQLNNDDLLKAECEKLVNNCDISLKKLQKQIDRDKIEYNHKFLGVFEFQFEGFILTMMFGFFSILPQVLAKLHTIFKND